MTLDPQAVWDLLIAALGGASIGMERQWSGHASGPAKHFAGVRTFTLLGLLAGLAGLFEAAGPFGQLTPQFPAGYGFTAIIVAFLGRLNPIGCLIAGIVLAVNQNMRHDQSVRGCRDLLNRGLLGGAGEGGQEEERQAHGPSL